MVKTEVLGRGVASKAVAYDDRFDRERAMPAAYVTRQLETFLGERLNVLLSKNKYEIKNNLIYGENMNDPFIDVIKRGIEYRSKLDGDQRVDKKREEAESEGFSKVQEILCNPNTPPETMIISVSPPGEGVSIYKHNFYDIFTLKKEGEKKFIEARRYSSALSNNEYQDKLSLFYPKLYGKDVNVTDVYFLSHPVMANSLFQNPDQLHEYFHKNHKFMKEEHFEQVIDACRLLINYYVEEVSINPNNVTRLRLILNAILNKADREADLIHTEKDIFYDAILGPNRVLDFRQEVEFLGNQPVRAVAAGCGPSGGFGKDKKSSSPFSVSDFGLSEDKYGDRKFECPECGKTNVRPKNELISNCQHCGTDKVGC